MSWPKGFTYEFFRLIVHYFRARALNMGWESQGCEPRSHSLVLRATGNRVSLWHESSNLSLGANFNLGYKYFKLICREYFFNHQSIMEPPARFELATSSLPMRCYTAKPRWRNASESPRDYNRFETSKNCLLDLLIGSENPLLCIFSPSKIKGLFFPLGDKEGDFLRWDIDGTRSRI